MSLDSFRLLGQPTASTSQHLETVPGLHIPSSTTPEALFEPESISLDEPPEIDDRPIQHDTDSKLLSSAEYSEDIYQYLKDLEVRFIVPRYGIRVVVHDAAGLGNTYASTPLSGYATRANMESTRYRG